MIAMRAVLVCVALTGCGFSPHEVAGDGPPRDTTADGDGSGSNGFAPAHLTSADGQPGSQVVILDGNTITIDTTTLTISGTTLQAGEFDARAQLVAGAPQVAVLHVQSLKVTAGTHVSISGTRPLIVVASGKIEIFGVLDAGAHGITPGAGGNAPGAGEAPGLHGNHSTTGGTTDSGGGGGGYGELGGAGGDIEGCTLAYPGGAPGAQTGTGAIAILTGGSGGGTGAGGSCSNNSGGAGGGAIQLTSLTAISVEAGGAIVSGGGGGTGGTDCGSIDGNSGAGGGAGGAILLQAPAITNQGVVAANGGGGGGGGTGSGTTAGLETGDPGLDGDASDVAAGGGAGIGVSGNPGGHGGAKGIAAEQPLAGACGDNAGGGGGAVGRIAVSASYNEMGTSSPQPNLSLPL
jgi:hypothetical protein